MLEHPISEDQLSHWRNSDITKQFLVEFAIEYLDELLDEGVVMGALIQEGTHAETPVFRQIQNPVEETAINCAISSGRKQALESVLDWTPANLDVETEEKGGEDDGDDKSPY